MSSTEKCCFFHTFMPETHHIMPTMWFSFCLDHRTQAFNFTAVFGACGHNIDTGGIDRAVAQNVGQFRNILVNAVEGSGKEFSQVMGKYLGFLDTRFPAKLLHLSPNAAAVQRLAAFSKKNHTGTDVPLPCIIQ